jgi:TPR repeat protein
MYRLGVRYEVRRNAAEAFRCYGKASHLGNAPAAARLLNLGATGRRCPRPTPRRVVMSACQDPAPRPAAAGARTRKRLAARPLHGSARLKETRHVQRRPVDG